MHPDRNASPLNPLPPVVWALVLPIAGIELAFEAGAKGYVGGRAAAGWRLGAREDWGFSGTVLDWMLVHRDAPLPYLARFVTYPFIHDGFGHALWACVLILALGKMVGEVFSAAAVLAVFFGAAVLGALAYGLAVPAAPILAGAYPAAYGLVGAVTFLIWTRLAGSGTTRLRAFSLIGFLMGFRLVFGLLFGGGPDWIADLAGFAAGFALSFVVAPGGFARAMDRIRQR